MIFDQKTLPTVFAKSIAESVDLVEELETGMNHVAYNKKMQRLVAFQQMAVTCSIEDAKIAFHGYELSELQNEALEVIYKSTKPWMLGHVVGILLEKINNKSTMNKDFAESVSTIVEQLTKADGKSTQKVKQMLVKLC
jgi:hypothetical protein